MKILDKKTIVSFAVSLVFIASWSLGNIVYLFPDLGEGNEGYAFIGGESEPIKFLDISLTFWIFGLIFVILTVFSLYLYMYHDMETLKIPILVASIPLLRGVLQFVAAMFSTETIILMAIIGISAFILTKKKKEWGLFNLVVVGILTVIGAISVYVMEKGATDFYILEYGSEESLIGGSGRGIVKGFQGIQMENVGLMVLGVLIVTVSVIITTPKVVSLIRTKRSKKDETSTDVEEDLSESVDRAINDLVDGKDVRSSIMRCYQRMCIILEEHGLIYDTCMTPREFEENAVDHLNLPRSTISDLTQTFEEARYSAHRMDEEHREKALKNLKMLREVID